MEHLNIFCPGGREFEKPNFKKFKFPASSRWEGIACWSFKLISTIRGRGRLFVLSAIKQEILIPQYEKMLFLHSLVNISNCFVQYNGSLYPMRR